MAIPKSPFLVFEEFLSAKQCEKIVDSLGFYSPDLDIGGDPIKMVRNHEASQELIFHRLQEILPFISTYYGIGYKGTEQMFFEYFPEGCSGSPHQCENSNYLRKKWVRTKDRDLSALLFLSHSNQHPPFDTDYEVYGGKVEFPQHGFGFDAERGTLIIYPSGPHFINAISPILYGDLFVVRFHIASALPFLYQPDKFPGNYKDWFETKI